MSKVAKFNAFEDEKPREECGVFGIYRNDDEIDSVVEVAELFPKRSAPMHLKNCRTEK